MIYVYKIENKVMFKIKTGYYLEQLMSKTMKLPRSTKSKINKDEDGENVSHLEINEVTLVHCNIFNHNYQQDSRVLYRLVANKSFGELLDISQNSFIFQKNFNSEFWYTDVWFTDKTSKPLEMQDQRNITLVINQSVKYRKCSIEGSNISKMWFLFFAKNMGKNVGEKNK